LVHLCQTSSLLSDPLPSASFCDAKNSINYLSFPLMRIQIFQTVCTDVEVKV
jgi:hypothetical protein